MRAVSPDVLSEFVIKEWGDEKKESVVMSSKKCGISNATDGTKDELLYEREDENVAEDDSPDSNWVPYYDETVNDDFHNERFASDDDDSSNFEGS